MSYFHFLGHPMNLKRCLSFLVVCVFTFFLALVPTSFYGVNPDTLEPIFTLTQQRVIAIFVFTAMMWILEVIPTWTTSVVAIVAILLTTSNKGLAFLMWSEKELDRNVFLRKYWFFDSISDIAERYSMRENTVKSMLFRTRNRLREFLRKEGIEV